MNKVYNFLNNFRVSGEGVFNYISMDDDFKGKFNVINDNYEQFIKIYAESVEEGNTYNIAEKPKDIGPILVDIDLKKSCDDYEAGRLYNNEMIFAVIDAYRTSLKKYLNLDDAELKVAYFKKPNPTLIKNYVKDGFHLIFYNINVNTKLRFLIRSEVIDILKDSILLKNFMEPIEKIIDKTIINSNCWMLPYSHKPESELYKLKYIYDANNNKASIINYTNKINLIKIVSLQSSIRSEDNATEYNDNINASVIDNEFLNLNSPINNDIDDNKTKSIILNCLKCLDIEKFDDYENWRDVALIINNELGFNGYDILNDWSKNGSNYNESKVKQFYFNIKPKTNGLKIGSLKKLAKEANSELYKKLFLKNISDKNSNSDDQENYNKLKIEFEKNNFKILNPINFITIDRDNDLIMRNKKEFKDVYENLTYEKFDTSINKFVKTSFVSDWLKDETMRTYEKLDFLPKQSTPNYIYNTFNGFEAENKKLIKTDIENSLIIKHIKNLCNNSNDVYDYVIKFLARKIQSPHILTNTALIFKSNEGAGKDMFFNWFGNKIIGTNYYYNTEKPELLFGKFTSALENKILIMVNETSGKDTFSINENIKCAITAENNIIEHKGLKPYKNTNHISYIFLTNNDNPLKVSIDDRRFCGIECNNAVCNNDAYFKALNDEFKNGEYDRAFYDYLLSIECDNYDFTNNRPKTSYYNDLQELNKPPLINFIENFIVKHNQKETIEISSTMLYNEFNDYITKFNFRCQITITKFIMDLKKLEGVDSKRSKTQRLTVIDVAKIKAYLLSKYKVEFSEIADEEDDEEETKSSLDI